MQRGPFQMGYIGYWVDEEVSGNGYVPEGVVLLIRFAFESLRLHRLEAAIVPRNAPSRRVAEKLGLRDEGTAERFLQIQGRYEDHIRYAITLEEWQERGAALVERFLTPRVGQADARVGAPRLVVAPVSAPAPRRGRREPQPAAGSGRPRNPYGFDRGDNRRRRGRGRSLAGARLAVELVDHVFTSLRSARSIWGSGSASSTISVSSAITGAGSGSASGRGSGTATTGARSGSVNAAIASATATGSATGSGSSSNGSNSNGSNSKTSGSGVSTAIATSSGSGSGSRTSARGSEGGACAKARSACCRLRLSTRSAACASRRLASPRTIGLLRRRRSREWHDGHRFASRSASTVKHVGQRHVSTPQPLRRRLVWYPESYLFGQSPH